MRSVCCLPKWLLEMIVSVTDIVRIEPRGCNILKCQIDNVMKVRLFYKDEDVRELRWINVDLSKYEREIAKSAGGTLRDNAL